MLRSSDDCLCQQSTAKSGLLWLYTDHHRFVSGPLSLPLRLLTFSHLLAVANLPPFPRECSISFSLFMLVASSAQGHSCIYVSLTNGWSWFQVPRDKRLLSVSKASESQEDQDKRYDNIYRNMPDSPDNSFFMFFTMIVLNYNFCSWEDVGVKKPDVCSLSFGAWTKLDFSVGRANCNFWFCNLQRVISVFQKGCKSQETEVIYWQDSPLLVWTFLLIQWLCNCDEALKGVRHLKMTFGKGERKEARLISV